MNQKERWAIHVDGILIPGFESEEKAKNHIREKKLDKKEAVVVKLRDFEPREEAAEIKPNLSR